LWVGIIIDFYFVVKYKWYNFAKFFK